MTKLSYSTFGLTRLDFLDAIDVVDQAGYPGIELSFHRDQFNPFEIADRTVALRGTGFAVSPESFERSGFREVESRWRSTGRHF